MCRSNDTSPAPVAAERRKHPRYGANDRVCVTLLPQTQAEPETRTFYCTAHDLSGEGLRFSGQHPFIAGEILDMLVVRGCAYWGFSLKGRVAWVRKNRSRPPSFSVGVEFVDVPEHTRLAWQDVIAR